ncbi:FAD:protein FMN transferase [Anderseniella sp. Alg231-50]|uniref:FAD:protein FMN transferase n=1 Tax=Anderseniella sp. Alg231-50 TaxID=1922226 RepID=UPI000D54B665
MKLSRRRFMTISACLAVAGAACPTNAKTVSWRGVALGAEAKLIITGMPETEARRLIRLALGEIDRLEDIFSLYRADSRLCLLNSKGVLQSPPPELLSTLSQVDAVHTATGGLFDPTVQPLWRAFAECGGRPDPKHVRSARGKIGWCHVRYGMREIEFDRPGMQLTLNGIAQGFVTDRISALLRSEGLENAVVNMGEISTLGHRPGGAGWRVGLTVNGDEAPTDFVEMKNRCVATSAPLATTFDGTNSHILSPITGRPVGSRWRRVSVVHRSAAIADGLSTAAVMMDEQQLAECMEKVAQVTVNARRCDGTLLAI